MDLNQNYEVNSKGWGGWGSSSTAMADTEPCCPAADAPAVEAVDEGVSVSESTSGSVGRKSLRRTNPEGASFTGTYLLSSRNLMHFSWAGTTRAGLVRISNEGSGSDFFSVGPSTCQVDKEIGLKNIIMIAQTNQIRMIICLCKCVYISEELGNSSEASATDRFKNTHVVCGSKIVFNIF